jgi:hypothetical protein
LIYLTADRILVLFFKKKNISPRQAIERNKLKIFLHKSTNYFNVSHLPWVEAPTAAIVRIGESKRNNLKNLECVCFHPYLNVVGQRDCTTPTGSGVALGCIAIIIRPRWGRGCTYQTRLRY